MAEAATPEFERARRIVEDAGWVSPAGLARIVLAAGGEVRLPRASRTSSTPVQLWRTDDPATGDLVLRANIASQVDVERGLASRG